MRFSANNFCAALAAGALIGPTNAIYAEIVSVTSHTTCRPQAPIQIAKPSIDQPAVAPIPIAKIERHRHRLGHRSVASEQGKFAATDHGDPGSGGSTGTAPALAVAAAFCMLAAKGIIRVGAAYITTNVARSIQNRHEHSHYMCKGGSRTCKRRVDRRNDKRSDSARDKRRTDGSHNSRVAGNAKYGRELM
jgi:hypothetical protein